MASVIEVVQEQERAREMLEIALGEKRVFFDDLSEADASKFLRETLVDVNLRELRGFKPLRELLTFRPSGSFLDCHTLDVEMLDLSPEVSLEVTALDPETSIRDLENLEIDLDSHFITICRGAKRLTTVYKRYETDEETSDWNVAHSWGRSAYHFKGSCLVLALRRPRNHTRADVNLFVITFWYEKVKLDRRHVITQIQVASISINGMRSFFGPSYPRIAVEITWELRDAYSRTVRELEGQLDFFRERDAWFEKRSHVVSYR